MNDKGDFYIGNQKKSALTGEETTFDNPVPTVAGEDPSRLSVVFDEVIVKERLVVEGGKSNNILSQFDGPVTFSSDVTNKGTVKIKNDTVSETFNDGALVVKGGVGIGLSLNVGGDISASGDLNVTGATNLNSQVGINTNLNVTGISTFESDVHFKDNTRLHFGTTIGDNDGFEIFENADGTGNGIIKHEKDGSNISITVTDGNEINFGTNGTTNLAVFTAGAGCTFRHNGSDKLEVIGTGVTITGQLSFDTGDTRAILLPQGRKVGMGTEFKFKIFENADGNGILKTDQDGKNISITVTDGNEINFGKNGTKNLAVFTAGAGCQLKHDGNTKLETVTGGVEVTGDLTLGGNIVLSDNEQIQFGNKSGGDLKIYHDSNDSYIMDEGNGAIIIRSVNGGSGAGAVVIDTDNAPASNTAAVVTQARFYSRSSGDANIGVRLHHNGDPADQNDRVRLDTTSAGVTIHGQLDVTGDIVAFSSSDLRLKTDINPIVDALSKVKSISGNTFEWNENSIHEGQDTGVVAQEIEALGLPGIAKERDDGYLGVRYEKLVPLLIEAIKELSDKVDNLEQKLSDK